MEGDKDELLKYFSEEYEQTYRKYAKRLPLEEFVAQQPKELKSQYQVSNYS
jgi:hypothetical protein